MSYKTNISNTTIQKRNQIQSRLDDFATFTWRGQEAFDVCGAFIIAEKRGDLKFYNGPSFSNEYTKPQFSSSSGSLTGVSFNRQQITFKMGAYWFSIEEWQDFIDWINAYEVNYLTFTHSPDYGYLVKLAKIADSPRYIVGYEDGQPRYYTEMDLTWDLQGENCVRANLPYEWNWENNQFSLDLKGPTKESRLETPLLLTIPLSYIDSSASLSFSVSYQDQEPIDLCSVSLNNLPYNSYKQNFQLKKQGLVFTESQRKEITITQKCWYEGIEYTGVHIIYQEDGRDSLFYPDDLQVITKEGNRSIDTDSILAVETASYEFLQYFTTQNVNDLLTQNMYLHSITIQYDSETGVLLYTAGDTNWKLLQLNLIDGEGNYLVSDIYTMKYKLKGEISNYKFDLQLEGLKVLDTPQLQIYERTNVI